MSEGRKSIKNVSNYVICSYVRNGGIMSSIDDAKNKKDINEIKIEGTLTNVEIAPEFLEWAVKKGKKCD